MFHSCNIISKRFIAKTTFTSKIRLNRHIVSVHEGKKPFKCDICDDENKPFKNNSCGASFSNVTLVSLARNENHQFMKERNLSAAGFVM